MPRRRRRKKPSKLSNVLKVIRSAGSRVFNYVKNKHLELSLLVLQIFTLNHLFNLTQFLREGMIALYIDSMFQGEMIKAILQTISVFMKDA